MQFPFTFSLYHYTPLSTIPVFHVQGDEVSIHVSADLPNDSHAGHVRHFITSEQQIKAQARIGPLQQQDNNLLLAIR